MRRIFLTSALFVLALAIHGCSGTATDIANVDESSAGSAEVYTDAKLALEEGSRLLDNDEIDKAIEVLNQAVALDPGLADAYFKLGIAYALVETRDADVIEDAGTPIPGTEDTRSDAEKKNSEIAFQRAVDAYKKYIDANKDDDAAYFNLGRAYNKLNKDEEAARALRQAVKLKPDNSEYQTLLGELLIKLAQYREAITALRKALEIDPESVKAEELLEEAEAGRRRVDFTLPKTPTPKPDGEAEASDANTAPPADKEKPKPPANAEPKPSLKPQPANKPVR
jgi:tetratricopeptide (TPR) repeat protein